MSDDTEVSGENEEVYEVEAIVDDRTRKGVQEFFVKWKGFSKSQNSWATIEDLGGAHDSVDAYIAKKLGRQDAASRRKPIVRAESEPEPDMEHLEKAKREKGAAKKAAKVKTIVGVKKAGSKTVFEAVTSKGKEVTVSRAALRRHNPLALLEFVQTVLRE
jgi:hypothetical protein